MRFEFKLQLSIFMLLGIQMVLNFFKLLNNMLRLGCFSVQLFDVHRKLM